MADSASFVGRTRELSGLRAVLDGDTRLLLVAGDAGVGKTRFVAESLRRAAADGLLPVWGACLPLAEKLPFLPVTEVLDALSRLEGGTLLERALDNVPPYARAETARLLPRLQPSDASAGGRAEGWQRGRLLAGVAELLAAVAQQVRLVLVIEDVQWADSATLDFLVFLTRPGRGEKLTVVATCRSDEAPLEPAVARWLAHMRGGGQVAEIRLAPLSRDEVAQQVAGLLDGPPPTGVADEVYARSEGNPFFAEQLVADAQARPGRTGLGQPGGLPIRLAELLAARASGCGPDARAVLAALAVAGWPLTEDQLSAMAGLGAEALRAGLQELAAARLLAETEPDGRYRPRHALLAEAVAAGLLPGERLALHQRAAQALEASGEETLAAEAADHWAAAGRGTEELRARVRAGAAAERVFGYAEAAEHWQRAIALRQAGPAAEDEAGMSLPELYVRAIDAHYVSGRAEDASVLAEEAYRRFAGLPDPAINAVIHERAARFRGLAAAYLGGQQAPGPSVPLITEALRLFEQAGPSAEYAEALFYYGHFLFFGEGRIEAGISAVNRGLEIAETAGATALIPRLLAMFAYHQFLCGQMEEGFAVLRRCEVLAESAGDSEAGILIDVYESDALLKTARLQSAADVALGGVRDARQAGLDDFWNTGILIANATEALVHQGRTAEAAALVEPLTDETPNADQWLLHLYRTEIDLLRGDADAAQERQQQLRARIGHIGNFDRIPRGGPAHRRSGAVGGTARRGAGGGAAGGRAGRELGMGDLLRAPAGSRDAGLRRPGRAGPGAARRARRRGGRGGRRRAGALGRPDDDRSVRRPPVRGGHRGRARHLGRRTHPAAGSERPSGLAYGGEGLGGAGLAAPGWIRRVAAGRGAAERGPGACGGQRAAGRSRSGSRPRAVAGRDRQAGAARPDPAPSRFRGSAGRVPAAGRADRALRAYWPGTDRAQAARGRTDQRPDRRGTVHQSQDGQRARDQHPAQASRHRPGTGRRHGRASRPLDDESPEL